MKVPNKPKARLMSLFDCVNEYLHFHTLALGEAESLLPEIPYRFEFWQDYELLDTIDKITSATELYFTIIPAAQYYKYGEVRNMTYTLNFDNTTNITTYTYNTSNMTTGNFNNTCLSVTRKGMLSGKTSVCDECSQNASGTIYSVLQATTQSVHPTHRFVSTVMAYRAIVLSLFYLCPVKNSIA